jgi:hypothetical protein
MFGAQVSSHRYYLEADRTLYLEKLEAINPELAQTMRNCLSESWAGIQQHLDKMES